MNQLVSEVAAMKKAHENVLMKYHSLIGLVKQLRFQLEAYKKNNNTMTMDHQDNEPTLQLNFEDLKWDGQQRTAVKSSTTISANTLVAQLVKSRDEIIHKSTKEVKGLRKKVRTLDGDLEKATECISSQKMEMQRYAQMVSGLEHNISMQALESEERLVTERKASTKIINDLIINVEESTEVAEVLQNTRAALASITNEHRMKLDELQRKTNEQALSEEEIINLKFKVQNLKEEKQKFLEQIKLDDLEIEEDRRMLSDALRVLKYTDEFKTDLFKMKDELKRVNTAYFALSSSSFTPRKEEAAATAVTAPNLTPLKGNDDDANKKWLSPTLKEDSTPHCENETMKQILSPILKTLSLLSSEDLYSTTTKQLCELTMTALQQEYSYRSMKSIEREGVVNTEGYGHRWKCNSSHNHHLSCVPKEAPHGLQKLRERLRAAQLRLLVLRDDNEQQL